MMSKEQFEKFKTYQRDMLDIRENACNRDKAVLQAGFDGYRQGVWDTLRNLEEEIDINEVKTDA